MVGFAPGLAPLSARPPTPPKESSTKLANADVTSVHSAIANRPLVDTPDESPSSSAEYFKASLEKAQKKVDFSPWTKFHSLPVSGSRDSDSEGLIRRLPPSKECKSLKSILKACTDNTTMLSDTEMLAFDRASLPAMLRSTMQHLANPSRASRLDAYTTLFACLSAYDEVPETKDLSERVVEITGCIRRDVSAKMDLDGSLDTQLVTQALKVLTVFLCLPNLATSIPEDFCSFILDRSISSIEDAGSSKILVSHYMHLLEKQKFTAKHLTTDRVNRLLSALDIVTTRMKGNRIICHRLMIYHRLLLQSKSVMVARVESWLENLISGMLSSIKDIRVRAIGLGVEAGLQLGTITSVSQACIELFNRANPEGKKVIDFLCTRLGEMTVNKEDGVHAPQIWSVVILFFRSRRRQLECWEHMKAWLIVIQRCLNCGDPQVKFQANLAWSRLIFVVNPDVSTSISMTKMLRQPLVTHLERKANDKNSKQAKQIARSTYCTLLYYALRPAATHAQLDQYWELYVAQILPNYFVGSRSDVNHAFDILAALLSSTGKPKVWDENRANMNGPVKPEELPCLDPKWIRQRADSIALIFDKLFDVADWQLGEDRQTSVLLAWRSFMTALGIASSKEVKVSLEAMNAVSTVLNQVKRLLERRNSRPQKREGPQPEISAKGDRADVYLKITILLREAVAKIGTIPFLERRLILTSQNAFEAAETPSSRTNRDSSSLNSPVTHLLKLLLKALPDPQPSLSYVNTIKAVMHITLQSANNRRTQLVALRNLARLLLVDDASNQRASLTLWQLIAEATSLAIRMPQQNDPHNASPQPPGHEYREAVKILELGVQQRSVEIIDVWQKLYDDVADSLREEICDDGTILMMTEPLTDVMRKYTATCDEALLLTAAILLKTTPWPQSYEPMERAQKMLWGVSHTTHKSSALKPFDNLCSMADTLLGSAYGRITALAVEAIGSFLSAVTSMIGSCPPEHQEFILLRTQPGLAAWIEDADGFLSSSVSSLLTHVSLSVNKLWSIVLTAIEKCLDHTTKLLSSIQHLLLSGFKSRHRSIVNLTIVMWNRTFGCAESLEYPEELRDTLLKLQRMTDIQLPAFPAAEMDNAMPSSPIHLSDSQDDELPSQDLPIARLPSRSATGSPLRASSKAPRALAFKPSSNLPVKSPLPARQDMKTTPKARLRHNDSQIQFAAIESSPLAPEPAVTQHLTDRQKEVKERQSLEAAMFPEIRSSPKSASRPTEYSLPKLVFKPNDDQVSRPAVDEHVSPMYPPDNLMNDFLGSSPTPASSKKGTNHIGSLNGLPSSPPFVSSYPKVNQQANPLVSLSLQAQPRVEAQDHLPGQLLNGNGSIREGHSNIGTDSSAIDHPNENPVPAAATMQPEDPIMSDFDVFVDAPSEPTEKVAQLLPNKDISTVYNSFQTEGSSDLANEDDQVTAQLISEMERASSQHSSKEYEAKKPASRASSKRKNPFDEDASAQKRARGMSASSDPSRRAQTRAAGQAVAECVMIDVRPAQVQLPASSVQVKRERSQSPSGMANIQSARKTPVARKRHRRLPGKSRPNQLSQEASSIPSRPQQSQATPEPDVNESSTANKSQSRARRSARLSDTVTSSSPGSAISATENRDSESGSLTNSGKRKASKFWYYTSEESPADDSKASTSDEDDTAVAAIQNGSDKLQRSDQQQRLSGKQHTTGADPQDHGRRAPETNDDKEIPQPKAVADVETLEDPPTPEGIVQGFRKMLSNIKRVALGREDEREISKILFQSMEELHEAGRRYTAM